MIKGPQNDNLCKNNELTKMLLIFYNNSPTADPCVQQIYKMATKTFLFVRLIMLIYVRYLRSLL